MEAIVVDIIFLGTGDAFSYGRRTHLSLLIKAPGFSMLVEAGPAIVQQLARIELPVAEIEHIFVSHPHGDHTLGFPMLVLNRYMATSPLRVYAGGSTLDTLETLCMASFPGVGFHRLENVQWQALSERDRDERELAPGIALRTTVVPHAPGVPTLAARWDFADGPSFAFATDTVSCAATAELARGCDLLIHDAAFSTVLQPGRDHSKYFHSTARQAGEVARRAGCLRLALVHLGQEIGEHPDTLAEEARANTSLEVIVPEDGDRLPIRSH
jgi:ribonuclease Z